MKGYTCYMQHKKSQHAKCQHINKAACFRLLSTHLHKYLINSCYRELFRFNVKSCKYFVLSQPACQSQPARASQQTASRPNSQPASQPATSQSARQTAIQTNFNQQTFLQIKVMIGTKVTCLCKRTIIGNRTA